LVRQALHEIQNLCVAKSRAELLVGRIGPGIQQVGADGVVEEMSLWVTMPDTAVERVELKVADIDAVDADGAALRVVEARDKMGDGGFAGSRGSDQGDQLARSNAEADVVEDGCLRALVGNGDGFQRGEGYFGRRGIAEADAIELDGGGPGGMGTGWALSRIMGGRSRTSKTLSNETRAVMMLTWTLERPRSGA